MRVFGGEEGELYQQLILGRHGRAAYQVIPTDTMEVESADVYPFYSYIYNSSHVAHGIDFTEKLQRHALPKATNTVIAIDPGFVDSAIIQVFSQDKKGTWRVNVRYRLTRINFKDQQDIIHWLATYYNCSAIAIDTGAGGNGSSIMHNLMHSPQYAGYDYTNRMVGVQFKENVLTGYDEVGNELFQEAKAFATTELARMIQDKQLVFSELDHEGMSELSRVAKQKGITGRDRYYVLNEKGAGASTEDHIYACYVVWALAVHQAVQTPRIELGMPEGMHTKLGN